MNKMAATHTASCGPSTHDYYSAHLPIQGHFSSLRHHVKVAQGFYTATKPYRLLHLQPRWWRSEWLLLLVDSCVRLLSSFI